MIEVGRPPQEKLRTQPPVGNVDAFFRCLQGNADCPEIIPAVDVPIDFVAFAFGGERLEAVGFSDTGALLVGGLLVGFIVTMVGVDDVLELANFMLEIDGADLDVMQVRVWRVRRSKISMFTVFRFRS